MISDEYHDKLMAINASHSISTEKIATAASGWTMLPINFATLIAGMLIFSRAPSHGSPGMAVLGVFVVIAAILSFCGHFTLQPNEARLLILFGEYKGTVRESGFYWANPLYARNRATIPGAGLQ